MSADLRPILGPWAPMPGGAMRYWRLPDGRDIVAVRAYDNRDGGWVAYPRDPEGRELSTVAVPKQRRKLALAAIDAAMGWSP